MSKKKPVIFSDHGSEYVADACAPFEKAVAKGDINGSAWSRGQYPGIRIKYKQLQGISTIGYWDSDKDQDWFVPPHYNEGIEISMVLNGEVTFETCGKTEILTPRQVALTSPWQKHAHGRPAITASKLIYFVLDVGVRRPNGKWVWPDWILLTNEEKRELGNNISRNAYPVFTANPEILWGLERMYHLLANGAPDKDASAMSVYCNLVLTGLSKALKAQPQTGAQRSDTHETVKVFLQGLEDHLSDPWCLDEMARQCGLSRSQFTTVFQELTNKSPIVYLNHLRLNNAARALEFRNGVSITDICFDCGFGSSQYFSRRFSEYFGQSPKEYRKSKGIPHTAMAGYN